MLGLIVRTQKRENVLILFQVGTAGIPQDNLINIFVGLSTLGLSTNNIVKVISVEWFIERLVIWSKLIINSTNVSVWWNT